MHEEMGFAHRGTLNLNHVFAVDGMGGFTTIERGPPYMRIQAGNVCGPEGIGCANDQLKGGMKAGVNGTTFCPDASQQLEGGQQESGVENQKILTAERELESRSASGSTTVVMAQMKGN